MSHIEISSETPNCYASITPRAPSLYAGYATYGKSITNYHPNNPAIESPKVPFPSSLLFFRPCSTSLILSAISPAFLASICTLRSSKSRSIGVIFLIFSRSFI